MISEILGEAGWNTYIVGKWQAGLPRQSPGADAGPAAPRGGASLMPVGCHDPDSPGSAQMNRFGVQHSRPPITLSSWHRKRRHTLAKGGGAWRSTA
jgi:arylsulfatase A-like enzyme